jgi:hypothetical protein
MSDEATVVVVGSWFTVCVIEATLFSQPSVPVKLAVMVWLPTPCVELFELALPWPGETVPGRLGPSSKTTVSMGVLEATMSADTVAVEVADWPNSEDAGGAPMVVKSDGGGGVRARTVRTTS